MPNLFTLFDEKLKKPHDMVASEPQSLETISSKTEEQEFILKKIKQFELVRPKVDFSDFSNFVFFNSALDYFNITGELILNQYPYDGTLETIEAFHDDLDDYQRYVLFNQWPVSSGHLKFVPSVNPYVLVDDVGREDGVTKTSLLSPNTGSWSLEFWAIPPPALTGSNDVMVVLQKASGSDGYTAYFTGSEIRCRFASASIAEEISAPAIPGQVTYFSFILDRTEATPILSSVTGSQSSFPVVVNSASSQLVDNLNFSQTQMIMGSGSLASKVVRQLTGSLDNVRIWNVARSLLDLSSSFNTKIYAQKNLLGLWRFNETALTSSGLFAVPFEQNAVVLDHSGHGLHGTIRNYQTSVRSSGSLVPFEEPDYVVSFDAAEIKDFIYEQQTSGSAHDRDNDNLITRLLPDQFFQLEAYKNTDVLEKFLFVLARQFDDLKIRIDQFTNVLRTHYGLNDQSPDALIPDVGKFFGWEFTGNFLNSSAFQYILGKNVLPGLESNRALDEKLYEIKNEFWRRTLINLMYLYKTKGTRESVESLLRIYGVNKNFVRLKEYGFKTNVGLSTFRIASEKSVAALAFGSGSHPGVTNYLLDSDRFTSQFWMFSGSVSRYGFGAPLYTGHTYSNITASAAPGVMILYGNSDRRATTIFNDSPFSMFLLLATGSVAAVTSENYTVRVPAYSSYLAYEAPTFTGSIAAVWEAASGSARVTEVEGMEYAESPNGQVTAGIMMITSASSEAAIFQTSSFVSASVPYVFSAYVKTDEGNKYFRLSRTNGNSWGNATVSPTFTASTSWQRFSVIVTASAGEPISAFYLGSEQKTPYAASTGTYFVWGGNLTQGSTLYDPIYTFNAPALLAAGVASEEFSTLARTVETRLRFPTQTSAGLTASFASGTIWSLRDSNDFRYQLTYAKETPGSLTGSLLLSSSIGTLELSGANIFDNRWYNVAMVRIPSSSSMVLSVRSVDGTEIDKYLSASQTGTTPAGLSTLALRLGPTGSQMPECWMQEVRVWDQALTDVELDDHTLNFQSFGTQEVDGLPDLALHWRLNENVTASADSPAGSIILNDVSGHDVTGSYYGLLASSQVYKKFLNEYNFIAPPDYGWNEEKIRVLESSAVSPRDTFNDNPMLALEFNMVDALNEDISQILATMDGFNNSIGVPANRYRDEYPDLEVLRTNYFKRLNGQLNFRVFFDMLEFFDRSFVDMVRRLIPARAVFLGDEFVVESHMLERSKLRWNYRRQERPFQPEGRIKVFIRS